MKIFVGCVLTSYYDGDQEKLFSEAHVVSPFKNQIAVNAAVCGPATQSTKSGKVSSKVDLFNYHLILISFSLCQVRFLCWYISYSGLFIILCLCFIFVAYKNHQIGMTGNELLFNNLHLYILWQQSTDC